jgi:arylsulfatase A-like enzyme
MEQQHWFGSITAMDEQIGRLRNRLKELDVMHNTILWFCSDNGPSYIHNHNSSGGLRGKKAELYEGGIRVPAILEWPARVEGGRLCDYPSSTSDFLPTMLGICHVEPVKSLPLDGQNILPQVLGERQEVSRFIFFQSPLPRRLKKSTSSEEEQFAAIKGNHKLISTDNGASYQLYDLQNDRGERKDLSDSNKEMESNMKSALNAWRLSCRNSARGMDYK